MKKLLLLSVVLLLFAGCSKDETTSSGQADQTEAFVPHFYGAAMLNTPAPATRGVANAMKVWSKPMAANNLTVKFLNGSAGYQEYVKEVAKEWEKAAGVRFHFVGSDKPATVRIGFDYVPGMMSSWSLTGTDHMQVYGQQSEATMHFAQWRRAGVERDLHLADFEVKQNSPSMGKTLKELNFRQKCNVNIVTIIRGEQRINIPGGEERLYPFDKLVVVGADVDLEHFRQYLVERYKKAQTDKEQTTHEVNMEQFTIAEGSHLIGRTILESGIRDRSACLVIGIERGSSSIKNPSPSTVFEEGDIVWIVGEHEKVVQLSEGKTVNN